MNDIDELLKEAPTLTFEPLPDTEPQVPAEAVKAEKRWRAKSFACAKKKKATLLSLIRTI